MKQEPLTQSIQDYLKHIYNLSADGTPASTKGNSTFSSARIDATRLNC